MTPFVLHMARRLGMPPVPYLIAVATSSNIGSVATITGNPQNMLIGSLSGISYLDFIARLGPIAAAGLFLNWALIYWLCLRGAGDRAAVAEVLSAPEFRHAAMRKKPVVVLIVVLAGFLAGVPPAMMAAIGAALLLITRTVEPRKVYQEIDWGLLIFFVGLFVIVAGADRAGLTATLLAAGCRLGSASHRDFRAGHRPPVERRQQRSRGDAAANAGVELSGSPLRVADAGDGVDAGGEPDDYRFDGQHHRRRARRGRRCAIGFGEFLRIGVPVTVATLAWGAAWLWMTG